MEVVEVIIVNSCDRGSSPTPGWETGGEVGCAKSRYIASSGPR